MSKQSSQRQGDEFIGRIKFHKCANSWASMILTCSSKTASKNAIKRPIEMHLKRAHSKPKAFILV